MMSFTRGKSGWSAREELHLLDAVEQYGFGNWEDISKHVETRTPDEAKEEYINKYITGCIGRHTWSTANENLPKLVDHTVADRGPLSQQLAQKLPPIEVTPEEALQLLYMPNRNDFEREYDSTAETLVSSLFLSPNDEDTDLVLKLAQLDVYTRKLRERTRRKRMVRDYQLIMNFFRGKVRRRQSKDQREFRDRYRVFAQFYTSFEFNRHLAAFEREKVLRVRLSELYRYRWNGLTKFDDCIHFEQHAAAIQNKNTGPYGLQGKTVSLQALIITLSSVPKIEILWCWKPCSLSRIFRKMPPQSDEFIINLLPLHSFLGSIDDGMKALKNTSDRACSMESMTKLLSPLFSIYLLC